MEVKYDELDDRYIKKEELEEKVMDITKHKFVTQTDFNLIRGQISGIEFELKKNTDILNKIYETSSQTHQQQLSQRAELDEVARALKKAQQNLMKQVWTSLPFIVRSILTFLLIFILLICASMMIGHEADLFMRDNGLFVTLFSGVVSIFIAKNGGDKK